MSDLEFLNEKRKIQRERVCNTPLDIITDEKFTDDSVQIYHKKEHINNDEKAECYLKSTLKSSFTAIPDESSPPVTEWRRFEEGKWIDKPRTHRIYKLPLSGIWITGESARKLVCSKNRIFLIKKPAIKMIIGSRFGMSNIHDFLADVFEIIELDSVGNHYNRKCHIQLNSTDIVPKSVEFYENVNLKCFRKIKERILSKGYTELINILNTIDYNNMSEDPRDKLTMISNKIDELLLINDNNDLREIKILINNCLRELYNFILYRDENLGGKFLIDEDYKDEVEENELQESSDNEVEENGLQESSDNEVEENGLQESSDNEVEEVIYEDDPRYEEIARSLDRPGMQGVFINGVLQDENSDNEIEVQENYEN